MEVGTTSERNELKLAVMSEKIINIEKDMSEVKESVKELLNKLDSHYVTRGEFIPVRTVVYGLIALLVTAVIGALLRLIVVQ